MPHDFPDIWILKNETDEQNRNILEEQTDGCPRAGVAGQVNKVTGLGSASRQRRDNRGDRKCSTKNTVRDTAITMHGVRCALGSPG